MQTCKSTCLLLSAESLNQLSVDILLPTSIYVVMEKQFDGWILHHPFAH